MKLWKQILVLAVLGGGAYAAPMAYERYLVAVTPKAGPPPGELARGPAGGQNPAGASQEQRPQGQGQAQGQGQGGQTPAGQQASAGAGQSQGFGQGAGPAAGQGQGQRPPGAQGPGGQGPGGQGGRGGFNQGPIPVEAVTAAMSRIETAIDAVGTTFARRAVEIVPLAAGRVRTLAIEPGRRVVAGDILMELDNEIETANLTEAEAKLREANAALERARTLRRNNTIADAQLDQAQSAVTIAQAEVDRARRRLADRVVRAPFDGITGLNRVEFGQSVTMQSVLTTLDDLSAVEIEFSAPELLYGRVTLGQAIKADAAAFPGRVFEGKVVSIDSRIDMTSRAFKVRASIPNPDLALPAGMFMHLSLKLNPRDAIMIPEEAIVAQAGKTYVFIVKDGKAARREVEVGQREVGQVEVVSGIAAGDKVVTRGVQRLREGADVRLPGEATPQGQGGRPPTPGATPEGAPAAQPQATAPARPQGT